MKKEGSISSTHSLQTKWLQIGPGSQTVELLIDFLNSFKHYCSQQRFKVVA